MYFCTFCLSDRDHLRIAVANIFREYKILNLLDFTSKRKRMSVILRDEEGQILLLCKGADRLEY